MLYEPDNDRKLKRKNKNKKKKKRKLKSKSRKTAMDLQELRILDKNVLNIYMRTMGKSESDILNLMKERVILTAEEAKGLWIIDEILSPGVTSLSDFVHNPYERINPEDERINPEDESDLEDESGLEDE